MDLTGLSSEQLSRALQSLERSVEAGNTGSQELHELVHELRVQRLRLEMQNRALRETQSELEAALQRYGDLYDHLPIGYVTLGRSGRIMHANLTAAAWLRRDRNALIGGYMNWFLDPFDAGRFAAHLESCLVTGSETLLDMTLRLDSGLQLTVQLSSRRAPDSPGAEPAIHTAITNITKLRQARDLIEDIDREQDALNSTLAQDLRAPLVALSNFTRSILREHGNELPPDVRNMVERMECAAVRLEATLHQLLDYSCLAPGEIALDPISLDEVVDNVLVEHRARIERYGAEVVVDRPLTCVRGSRLILSQVLVNVLTHALNAAGPGGKPRLRISATARGGAVVLRIGFEPAAASDAAAPELAQRFRVFERAGNGIYQSGSIAFAITRRAIERMKGRVWLESTPGQPDSFQLELPAV